MSSRVALNRSLYWYSLTKARRMHELDFLCSVFSDEGKGINSLFNSQAPQILFKGFVIFFEA